jgi:hypothetical protein
LAPSGVAKLRSSAVRSGLGDASKSVVFAASSRVLFVVFAGIAISGCSKWLQTGAAEGGKLDENVPPPAPVPAKSGQKQTLH